MLACAIGALAIVGQGSPAASETVRVPAASGRLTSPASLGQRDGDTPVVQFADSDTSTPGGMSHPGIVLDQSQLDFVRSKVAAGAEPWASAYARLVAPDSDTGNGGPFSSLTYQDKPVPQVSCVASNADRTLNVGCNALTDDSIAAYTDALVWAYTGNVAYADKAVSIMNDWSATLHNIVFNSTYSNGMLVAGWSAETIVRAAEIMRSTYDGWAGADISRFSDMLKSVYLPMVNHGWTGGGANWLMTFVDATMNIGVFTGDRATFDLAVAQWRAVLPSEIYLSSDVNPYPQLRGRPIPPPGTNYDRSNVTPAKMDAYWFNPGTYVDGLQGETCRDMGHTTMGLDSMLAAAETARLQGVDLYTGNTDRMVAGYEFNSRYFAQQLSTGGVPSWLCGGKINLSNSYMLGWETGFNALHNRLGIPMPYTEDFLKNYVRKGSRKAATSMAWEELTSADSGDVCDSPKRTLGAVEVTATVPKTGRYRLWARVNAATDTPATFAMQVDGGCAVAAGGDAGHAGTWDWVGSRRGQPGSTITIDLTAGQHTIRVADASPGLRIDTVLLSDDIGCVPVGDGSECLSDSNPPTTPEGLVADHVTANRVSLSWTAAEDDVAVASYQITRNGSVTDVVDAAQTTFVDDQVSPGVAYEYAVTAVDRSGNTSPPTPALNVTTPEPPDPATAPTAPQDLKAADVSGTDVRLTWGASSDDNGVERYIVQRDGSQVGTVDADGGTGDLTFTDSGLRPATSYSYDVHAVDGDELASPDANVTVSTRDTVPPAAPLGLRTTDLAPDSVSLAWDAASDNVGVTGYDVFRDGTKVATTASPSFIDRSLVPATAYQYTVVALDASGNTSARTSTISTATAPRPDTSAPTTPASFTARVTALGQVTLAWTAATDDDAVAGYRLNRGGTTVASPTALTYVDGGLAPGTPYTYSLAAVDPAGNVSAPVQANVTTARDAAPAGAGFAGSYFPNTTLSGAAIARLDPAVSFSWGTGSPIPGIGTTSYSVRWSGRLTPSKSGSYTFFTQTDDGLRLYLDDTLLIGRWTAGSGTSSKTVTLKAGTGYNLRLEYYEGTGPSAASLMWSGPGIAKATLPSTVVNSASSGLSAAYFANPNLTGTPAVQRLDKNVAFSWGTGRADSRLPTDNFSARWTGKLIAPATGTYTFSTDSDAGIRLWVNGQELVDNWTSHALTTNTGKISLVAGSSYDVRVEYFDTTGAATAKLSWAYNKVTKTPVPSGALRDR